MASKSKEIQIYPPDIRSGKDWEIFYHISFQVLSKYPFKTFNNPIFSPEEALSVACEIKKSGYIPKIEKIIMSRISAFGTRKNIFHKALTISKLEKALQDEKLAKDK